MQAKDLVVLGDARILGRLYAEPVETPTQPPNIPATRKSKLIPSSNSATEQPTQDCEICWYYG